jgi:predicted DNA-binding antitoxin AbrB/MazE fold protein
MTIRAVFENGVFRPTEQVKLAEGTVVDLQIVEETVDVRALVPPGTDEGLIQAYEILGRRFNSGHHDTAERHNEHQP